MIRGQCFAAALLVRLDQVRNFRGYRHQCDQGESRILLLSSAF